MSLEQVFLRVCAEDKSDSNDKPIIFHSEDNISTTCNNNTNNNLYNNNNNEKTKNKDIGAKNEQMFSSDPYAEAKRSRINIDNTCE